MENYIFCPVNKFNLRRNEPLNTEYRLINLEQKKAFTLNELSFQMEKRIRKFTQLNECIIASENQIKRTAIGDESFP